MRTSKSILAGVAAGALGLALVPLVGVGTASATAWTATTSPVRVTYTATTLDPVPYARVAFTGAGADDTATVTLSSAPSAGARVTLAAAQVVAPNAASFTTAANNASLAAGSSAPGVALSGTDDSAVWIAADTPGTYIGTIQTYNAGAAANTASFTFTTRGAPATFDLKVNSPSVPLTTTNLNMFTLSVKDAGGSLTQLESVDGVTMATTEANVVWTSPAASITSPSLYAGTLAVTMATSTVAGTYTVSATPTGTPWGTAQTGSYSVINNVAATSIALVDSANALNQVTATSGAGSGILRPGATTATFAVTSATPGAPIVVYLSGTAFATAPAPVVVTTNAQGIGTFTVDVPASGALLNRTVVATQGARTYTATYTIGTIDCSTISRTPSAGTIALPTGKAQPVVFSIDDSYGNPASGMVVVATSGSTVKSATTGTNGIATIELPDLSTSSVTSKTWTFTVDDPTSVTNPDVTGCASGGARPLVLEYSAAGTVTIASPTYNTATEAAWVAAGTKPVVPYTGTIVPNAGSVTTPGRLVALGATVGVQNVNVDFTAGEGVWFCADDTSTLGTTAFAANCSEKAGTFTAVGSTVTGYVTSTKTGPQTITATTSSGATVTWSVTFASEDAAARNITLTAAPPKQQTNRAVEAKVRVTDVFGNAVAMTAGGASINLTTDKGTLAGGLNIVNIDVTLADGTATVMATSPLPGIATITATGTGGQFGNAVNVPFTGAAKSASPATVAVEWTGAASESITITGSRTTVSGKPGIKIDGAVTGQEDGKTVVPYFRFPGETTFAQGTARPSIEGGKFTWQRKTGKKFYAYVTSDDGVVKSNRVIIAAN